MLKKLGYSDEDFAIGYRVRVNDASRNFNKEADIVAFDDKTNPNLNAPLLIEAKSNNKLINNDDVAQARYYCRELHTPYYMVTNGEEIRIYLYRGSSYQPDHPLMNFKRSEIKQNWNFLYKHVNKSAILQYKKKLEQLYNEI
ncbi:MAG: type I restriction enzyme HsdR N-terminal domain-containing protein [Pyrinomonadaceae bacterium]